MYVYRVGTKSKKGEVGPLSSATIKPILYSVTWSMWVKKKLNIHILKFYNIVTRIGVKEK